MYLAIPQQCIIRGSTPSLFTEHVCSEKSASWVSTSVTENFIKIKFFDFKSNFDQATQKKIKKAILYGKINFNDAKNCGTNMMSQINAPIHSYKNPRIYYLETWKQCFGFWHLTFRIYFNSYQANETRYIDSIRRLI